MEQGTKKVQTGAQLGDRLESYRRLVELQKEMIQLAQQNERAQQACSELREQVAREAASLSAARRTSWPKSPLPSPVMATAKPKLVSLQPSTC